MNKPFYSKLLSFRFCFFGNSWKESRIEFSVGLFYIDINVWIPWFNIEYKYWHIVSGWIKLGRTIR